MCSVESAIELGARSLEEQRAQLRTCSASQAGLLRGGWAAPPSCQWGLDWPPAGCPPPRRRRGAERVFGCRGGRAPRSCRRGHCSLSEGGTATLAVPGFGAGAAAGSASSTRWLAALPPPPHWSPALVPKISVRQRPERPGELLDARVSGHQRFSDPSRASPPAFAFVAAARLGLLE